MAVVIDAFVEGTRSIVQACHLVILVPVAVAMLAARARWQVVVGAVVGVVLGGWWFATRWIVLTDTQIRWSGLLVAVLVLALAAPSVAAVVGAGPSDSADVGDTERVGETVRVGEGRAGEAGREKVRVGAGGVGDGRGPHGVAGRIGWLDILGRPWVGAVGAGLVGVIVTTWWRPCVGEELGRILTLAPDEPFGRLPATVGFMLGVSLPLIGLGLVVGALRPSVRGARFAAVAASVVGLVLAASVVAGQQGEIVATLFEWSQ